MTANKIGHRFTEKCNSHLLVIWKEAAALQQTDQTSLQNKIVNNFCRLHLLTQLIIYGGTMLQLNGIMVTALGTQSIAYITNKQGV